MDTTQARADECTHDRIQTWLLEETGKPAGMWSCVACSRKFVPLALSQRAEPSVSGEPVAWMHTFTDPFSGERRSEPRRNRPSNSEILPGDTVRPLIYGDVAHPATAGSDARDAAQKERAAILEQLDEFIPATGDGWPAVNEIRALIAARGAA